METPASPVTPVKNIQNLKCPGAPIVPKKIMVLTGEIPKFPDIK